MEIIFFTSLLIIILPFCIDLLTGELPATIHPVVWMGKSIEKFKPVFLTESPIKNRFMGFFMTMFLIFVFVGGFDAVLIISSFNQILYLVLAVLVLSTTFSVKYLLRSACEVGENLSEDLQKGRKSVSFLVSRDTSNLSSQEVVSATIETLTENLTDSVIAPLFYTFIFVLIGLFAVSSSQSVPSEFINHSYQIPILLAVTTGLIYRVVNTLDAMVGYKDPENIDIGWFPARLDDCFNYIPARLTGLLMVVSSFITSLDYKQAWNIMLREAQNTPSPNSGYPMAAAAGALNVQLVKPGVYTLGNSNVPLTNEKIDESIKLSKVTIYLFLMTIVIILLIVLFCSF
ncbi:cobalamin biosynthesis protein [Methanobacterium petrolearium]|uniref:cobalamin biosynthesis protein n=1 Tax=Methanobacterium petrolearium TaxID=710190 RepID=UPI001AEB3CF7|nr:cobalamin biosynthesis protein [Methanobacterium petrolearium]MBP1944825.1 adenosylcobinamide-phosphate synthase [Methanobacterium petrolearium]BDZ70111.1 cobalamin biosynthesis protein CobD [Methanobacterium petrolearium]